MWSTDVDVTFAITLCPRNIETKPHGNDRNAWLVNDVLSCIIIPSTFSLSLSLSLMSLPYSRLVLPHLAGGTSCWDGL